MTTLRKGYYLLLGFTFPFYWAAHAAGFMATLYRPLQLLCHDRHRLAVFDHRLAALLRRGRGIRTAVPGAGQRHP
ncbi:MAG: hypothetical protein ACYC9M_13190 [Desulfobulbaceae bacterium]